MGGTSGREIDNDISEVWQRGHKAEAALAIPYSYRLSVEVNIVRLMEAVGESSVLVPVPSWFYAGNPAGFAIASGLRLRDRGNGLFELRSEESYSGSRPGLVSCIDVAGPSMRRERFDELAQFTERVTVASPGRLYEEIAEAKARLEAATEFDPTLFLYYSRLVLYATRIEDLPATAKDVVTSLREIPFEDDTLPFAGSGMQVMVFDDRLRSRLKLPSVRLRIEHDPALHTEDPVPPSDPGHAFDASSGLHPGSMLFDSYVAPLLLCMSPFIWSVDVLRTFGHVVWTLGAPVSGVRSRPVEPLQLMPSIGSGTSAPYPRVSRTASMAAVMWWATKLDRLMSVLSDPATFGDSNRVYRPAVHLQAILTIEQAFRRTGSILFAHRDHTARLPLLFTVLDTLEALTGRTIEATCNLDHAERTLDRLTRSMGTEAAEVLLNSSRRGVTALRQMQSGFFIAKQSGASGIEVPWQGGSRVLSRAEAVSRYIKVLRNATHGHGSRRGSDGHAATAEALLANHDGEIPHDLGLLAHLYLVDLLAEPERLSKILRRQSL